ncbi:MAG: hypothetical protein RLZZ283_395 [Candidatus Parcubacteria bacterium]|jgi:hypothetical protein
MMRTPEGAPGMSRQDKWNRLLQNVHQEPAGNQELVLKKRKPIYRGGARRRNAGARVDATVSIQDQF